MTLRQRVLHTTVTAMRNDIVAGLARHPLRVGDSVIVRLAPSFVPFGRTGIRGPISDMVTLMRDTDRLLYREYRIRRKGEHEPRWRTLAQISGE